MSMRSHQITTFISARYVGPDNDFVYRYGDNIIDLSKLVNTDNIGTRINAKGKDNLVQIYVTKKAD